MELLTTMVLILDGNIHNLRKCKEIWVVSEKTNDLTDIPLPENTCVLDLI